MKYFFHKGNVQAQLVSVVNIKYFKEKSYGPSQTLKIEEEGALPSLFSEVCITLMPKLASITSQSNSKKNPLKIKVPNE